MEITRRRFTETLVTVAAGLQIHGNILPPVADLLSRLMVSPEDKSLDTQLAELEKRVRGRADKFERVIPELASLATRYFTEQLGTPHPERFNNRFHFQWQSEFVRVYKESATCSNAPSLDPEIPANTDPLTGEMYFNLSLLLYTTLATRRVRPEPVHFTFGVMLHELHHAAPPKVVKSGLIYLPSPGRPDYLEAAFDRGVVSHAYSPQFNLPGKSCLASIRGDLEEAIVHDSTERLLRPLGINVGVSADYFRIVQLYRERIINRLYGGDNRVLLRYHQASQVDQFFLDLGEKLGIPEDQRLEEAQRYTVAIGLGK